MKFEYSATFEFDVDPPLTVRGTGETRQYHQATKLALTDLKKQYPGKRPTSLVVVLTITERNKR